MPLVLKVINCHMYGLGMFISNVSLRLLHLTILYIVFTASIVDGHNETTIINTTSATTTPTTSTTSTKLTTSTFLTNFLTTKSTTSPVPPGNVTSQLLPQQPHKRYHEARNINWTRSNSQNQNKIHLISWRWSEIGNYFLIGAFLLIAASVKICYHHSHQLSSHLPESCVLIVLGTLVSFVFYITNVHESKYVPKFNSELFFYILLPPIILESAYSLYDKSFFNNLGTILLYAVVGTLINIALIGPSLYLCSEWGVFAGMRIPLIECLVFATLISAVDPVAVLAIFQEVNINKALYFLVFGESLLNDAVVVTMYNIMETLAKNSDVHVSDFFVGLLGFLITSGGGLFTGLFLGAISSIVTRFTGDVRVVEPLIVIVLAYISYIGAELFHFSGIIALIACGLMQSEYTRHNISKKSYTTIKYLTKTLSSIADVIIFLFLGMVLVRDDHIWDSGFVLLSTLFCIIYRFISVFFLTFFANHYFQRLRVVNFSEQVLMAYGGLRGAIAFCLAIMLDRQTIGQANLFITATLFVILFTVFIMGSTTKPIVRFLQVKIHIKHEAKLFLEINTKVVETVLAGIEEVAGHRSQNYWAQKFSRFNDHYVKAILIRGGAEKAGSIRNVYEKIYEDKEKQKLLPSDLSTSRINDGHMESKSKLTHPTALLSQDLESQTAIGGTTERLNRWATLTSAGSWRTRRVRTAPVQGNREGVEVPRRASIRPSRVARETEDVSKALADAFSRSAYYQYIGGINDVEDREELITKEKEMKNKWMRAKSKISLAAIASRSSQPGQSQEPLALASVVKAAKALADMKAHESQQSEDAKNGEDQV
ncbi:Na(+)/H(+) exchanger protein 7-like isoform X1 [Brevipalpus obovatus]|uniref:Na(+)/H(+) exchanger protein 7-like isoform X1 n=1 Tax=Brevipalpus obovatus TaxID=246614 RepID=UPI003D9F24F1